MLRQGFCWLTIEAEIAKCDVRCANCHRKQTFERSHNWRGSQDVQQATVNYQRMSEYFSIHPCVDCGEADIRLLEFDHVRGRKIATISWMLTQRRAWSSIEIEMAKCEVRCANCHRKRTAECDGDWWRMNG